MWIITRTNFLKNCRIEIGRVRRRIYREMTVLQAGAEDEKERHMNDQMRYLESAIKAPIIDWDSMKSVLLSKRGNINQRNIDAVLLKYIIAKNEFDLATLLADHLRRKKSFDLNIGTINSLLELYCDLGKQNKLCDKDREFIVNVCKYLHDKYKTLDSTTCERLLHALCVINEIEKAHEVFEEIYLSSEPSHSAFSTLIATHFKLDQKAQAMQIIQRSLDSKRVPLDEVYFEWINYVCRNYETENMIIENLEQILHFVSCHNISMSNYVALKLTDTFEKLNWTGKLTTIKKMNGQCQNCKEKLKCMNLELDEFNLLQKNVKERIIIGTDLFLKTTPKELQRFQNFIEKTAPYDVVLDALNIFYAPRQNEPVIGMKLLSYVVNYFVQCDKTVLLLGRQHMLKLNKRHMADILDKCSYFFTENLSQDDPYIVTAAILSGAHTDIVSKDILRNHKFVLKDEKLQQIFERWRWQHQWMVFHNKYTGTRIQKPWAFTPIAQKNRGWHLPYENPDRDTKGKVRDGTPDLATWLCLQPNVR